MRKNFFWALIPIAFGMNASAIEEIDGVYQIGTAAELAEFAELVNNGNIDIDGVLTSDIDFSANTEMIGTGNGNGAAVNPFRGTFDGQGHTITLGYNTDISHTALFHYVDGATIRNLTLDGSVESNKVHTAPVVGHMTGNCTFDKVFSAVNVTSTISGSTGDGGFVGVIYRGNITFNNCGVIGAINGENGNQYGGFAGWSYSSAVVTFNNCIVTSTFNGSASRSHTFVAGAAGSITLNNCYYLNAIGAKEGTQMSAEQFASGEVSYLLNWNQSEIAWYQNIGEDKYPVLDAVHSAVYATITRCDGMPLEGCEYTNDATSVTIPPHNYEGYSCTICGNVNPDYCEKAEGFYLIGNADQLVWFSLMVNSGNTTVNARLTADIDYSSNTEMIGTGNGNGAAVNPFRGIFDGQGHTITLGYNTDISHTALFHYVDGATIRNLKLDGSVESSQVHTAPVVGHLTGNCTFDKVFTTVNVTSTISGSTGDGGFVGIIYSGNTTFNNCGVAGAINGENGNQYGGFAGWSVSGAVMTFNNCIVASAFNGKAERSHTYVAGTPGAISLNNCYYLNAIGTEEGTQMSAEQFASGEVCFLLNKGQSDAAWYQTIGEDVMPVLDSSHLEVYATISRCDGMPMEGCEYTNDATSVTIPPHNYEGYICTLCGNINPDYCEKEDGFYLIGNDNQLVWFSLMVNKGNTTVNAKLTADIDFSANTEMIGTGNGNGAAVNPFRGIFDGQGYTITLGYNNTISHTALFHYVDGATIKNLNLNGNIVSDQVHLASVAGHTTGNNLFQNVMSTVNVTSDMDVASGASGMVGIIWNGSCTFNDCAFAGSLSGEYAFQMGGFVGWVYSNSMTVLNNCFSTASFNCGIRTSKTFATGTGTIRINNCYYLNPIDASQGIQMSAEQFADGTVCYQLNKGDLESPSWFQTLREDKYPVTDASHGTVFPVSDNEYFTVTDKSSLLEWLSLVVSNEQEYVMEVVASTAAKEKYEECIETLSNTTENKESVIHAYTILQEEKVEFVKNVEAYAAYMTLAQDIRDYMENNTISGTYAERLNAYLNGDVEPSDDFPNGGFKYVIDVAELDTEGIIAERDFLNTMYTDMVTHDFQKDTDITKLLVNADFHEGNNGWSGKDATRYYTELPLAECFNNICDLSQTLTGLKDGVYELDMNAFFRPAGRNDSRFYTTSLYINGMSVPVMSIEESPVTQDEDTNLEDYGAFEGNSLVPANVNGASAAFNKGYFTNRILVNVTDGTLVIGLRAEGTGMPNDWTAFGNTKLYYRGMLNESGDAVDAVLSGMANRAASLIEAKTDIGEYGIYPNFSVELKDRLQFAVNAAQDNSKSIEERYELISSFTSLFADVRDCQRAYADLMKRADAASYIFADLYENNIISKETFEGILAEYEGAVMAFDEGSFSTEEAKNWDMDLYTGEKDGEWYLISDPSELALFAFLVNNGDTGIKGRLTADIDFTEQKVMIGTGNGNGAAVNPFRGVFDGNGHTVTLGYNTTKPYTALFSFVDGVVIKNLTLDGNVQSDQVHTAPLAGHVTGNSTFENIFSIANVSSTRSGATGDGGLVGIVYSGNTTFNNCGVAGAINGENGNQYGGFAGWSSSSVVVTLNNCIVTSTFNGSASRSHTFVTGMAGSIRLNNCYYLNAIGTEEGTQMSAEQFASGEVCYLLNGNQSEIAWYQNIGEDSYPVLDASHGMVVRNEDGSYSTISGVELLTTNNGKQTIEIYDLSGRKVNRQLKKGIYIVDGKKTLVK